MGSYVKEEKKLIFFFFHFTANKIIAYKKTNKSDIDNEAHGETLENEHYIFARNQQLLNL